jgi:hypothetical protein
MDECDASTNLIDAENLDGLIKGDTEINEMNENRLKLKTMKYSQMIHLISRCNGSEYKSSVT